MICRSSVLLMVFAATTFVAAPAMAQQPTSAESLFRDGRRLMDSGNHVEACAKFAESLALERAAGTLLNLAACQEKIGKTASAWTLYKEAAKAAAARNRADWVATANERITALEPTLASIAIRVSPAALDVPGLRVERDGAEVVRADWGTPIPIDPGSHVVSASAPGRKAWTSRLDISAGAKLAAEVPALDPAPSSATSATEPERTPISADPPRTNERTWQKPAAIATGGAAVIALGMGTIFGLKASSEWSDAKSTCPSACDDKSYASWEDARSSATIATVGFVAAGVLAAAAVVLWITAPDTSRSAGLPRGFVGLAP